MAAAGNRHLGAVQALLERGADCNAADDYDETVLVRAAGSGNVPLVQALLAAGADPSRPGELSRLPHEEAEHCGHPDVAKLLRAALDTKRRSVPPKTPKPRGFRCSPSVRFLEAGNTRLFSQRRLASVPSRWRLLRRGHGLAQPSTIAS